MSSAERPQPLHQTLPLADIERFEQDGVRVVAVAGELDISNVGALEDAAFDVPNRMLGVVLDLSSTTYIDSATLSLVFRLQHGLRRRGQALRLVCAPGSSARRVLDLTGFDRESTYEEDRESAIAAIRANMAPGD